MPSLENWWLKMISLNLKKYVKVRGMKLKDLASETGISVQIIYAFSHKNKNIKSIKFEDMQAICKALDITPNELFGYESKR